MDVLEAINMTLIIIGVILITIPRIEALYVMVLGQIGWSVFAYLDNKHFFMIQSIFLLILNFVGIYNWRRKNVGK